jgi:hypothetical protein
MAEKSEVKSDAEMDGTLAEELGCSDLLSSSFPQAAASEAVARAAAQIAAVRR